MQNNEKNNKQGNLKDDKTPLQSENGGIKGDLTFDDKVIQKIIGIALEEIEGLLTVDGGFFSNLANKLVNTDNVTSGIDVEVGKKQVAVDLDIVVEYGKDITDIYGRIKQVLHREVKNMTGLEVIEVNVNVIDIKSKEQYEKEAVSVQDRVSDVAETTGNFVAKQTENTKNIVEKTGGKLNNRAANIKETVADKGEPRVQ